MKSYILVKVFGKKDGTDGHIETRSKFTAKKVIEYLKTTDKQYQETDSDKNLLLKEPDNNEWFEYLMNGIVIFMPQHFACSLELVTEK